MQCVHNMIHDDVFFDFNRALLDLSPAKCRRRHEILYSSYKYCFVALRKQIQQYRGVQYLVDVRQFTVALLPWKNLRDVLYHLVQYLLVQTNIL